MTATKSPKALLLRLLLKGILGLSLLTLATCLPAPNDSRTYDYVVIGSGPGGGVMATNLAKAGHSVLLLEAGDDSAADGFGSYSPAVTWDFFVRHYPPGDARNQQYSHLTWRTPEGKFWVGRPGAAPPGSTLLGIYYPRGATLGGSSMINAMATWLPSDGDWEYHANVTGDDSWRPENMRRIFTEMENNNYLKPGTPGHGFDGYFQTQMPAMQEAKVRPLEGNRVMQTYAEDLQLAQNMSDLLIRNPNELSPDRDQTQSIYGIVNHQYANGSRYSSRHYVQHEAARPGSLLTVSLHSLATRVLFETNTTCGGPKPRAVAVEYLEGRSVYGADARHTAEATGKPKTAWARREVVVSGGAFNSPQILMLSGVGPRQHLESLNISVVADVPGVGQNLMDNQEMPIVGSGSAGAGTAGMAMVKSKHPAHGERDMFLMGGPGFLFRGFWPSENRVGDLPPEPSNVYGVSMVKGSSVNNKGWVKLQSADPRDPPEINFNHFAQGSEPDMEAMKDTVAWIRTVFKRVGITPMEPPCPSGEDEAAGYCGASDEEWLHKQTFGHHPTSTNRIGADDDPLAVLDSKFRVRGVAGLRVVDASAFARIPGVFPVVSTFMISEKASREMIEEVKAGQGIDPVCCGSRLIQCLT